MCPSLKKSGGFKDSVGAYAVQCEECFKFRLIQTKEEFETIRENFTKDPWFCHKKPGVSCDDPADIEYDNKHIWAFDKPDIPKSPHNTERMLIMEKDCLKIYVYYIMQNGEKVRSCEEVENFLEAHPEYRNQISASNFSFAVPEIMDEDALGGIEAEASASTSSKSSPKKE